jgi:hypothetical protein
MSTQPLTAASLIEQHASDIAYVAEGTPALDVDQFIEHLETAASHLCDAGIQNAEELEEAARYLTDAEDAGDDQEALLRQATDLLHYVGDMVDEYRAMVGD